MTPTNPDYNLLIAVYVGLVVVYYCVQELLYIYMFSDKEKQEMQEMKDNAQKD